MINDSGVWFIEKQCLGDIENTKRLYIEKFISEQTIVPEFIYHITQSSRRDPIMRDGLTPRCESQQRY